MVGFDLTFSLIRQKSAQNRQYMVGVFVSTNVFKKIVVFGLAITNSQSVFAYTYIFRQFFELMGSPPNIVITDEEKGMYYALRNLKKEGIFKGSHLFDTFHILRKFRQSGIETTTFQLVRQMMHAKDKQQYRRLLRKTMRQLTNDKQLQTLRNFDLNSESYCYSQIEPGWVGIGVSNSPNEFFHYLIKYDITHALKYTKAVQAVMDLIERRIQFSRISTVERPFA